MTPQDRWNHVVAAICHDVDGFEVCFKETSSFHKLLGVLSVWSWSTNDQGQRTYGYMDMTTTMGNKIWFPSEAYVQEHLPANTLEHEWVHMKDAQTFFGWLSFMPAALNQMLFSIVYLVILPWPGFVRAYAELRAYRRSLELVPEEKREQYKAWVLEQFTGPGYLYMWPFPEQVERLLDKASPYKTLMDSATPKGQPT